MAHPLHLLLVGGGHAMLPSIQAASAWTARGIGVTLVNDHPYLYYSGMVPEYIGGVYRTEEVRIDLTALARKAGVRFIQARAVGLDSTARALTLDNGTRLRYDLAALDVGARNPGQPGGAIPTKPLYHMDTLAAVLGGLSASPGARLIIVGGGAAGVEVALNLSARYDRRTLQITLVERAPHLLPRFPPTLQRYVTEHLVRRGVSVSTATQTSYADAYAVYLRDGRALSADAVLWATGATGSSLFDATRLPCDTRGFLRVRSTLQSLGDARLFAAGDCAVIEGLEDLPRIGVHAVKQGPVLRANLESALARLQQGHGLATARFLRFRPYPLAPLILSTGLPKGLWVAGRVWRAGKSLLRMKHGLDRRWIRRYHPAWQDVPLSRLLDARAAVTAEVRPYIMP